MNYNRMEDTTTVTTNAASRVPPELWLVILQHAIHVDNEMLHMGSYDLFGSAPYIISPPFAWSDADISDIRRNIGLRHNLSLVCRQWHSLLSPALYEIVLLRSDAAVRLIHRTLVMTAGRSELGRHTRHFILGRETPLKPRSESAPTHESADLLTALFRCMPSLQTVSLRPGIVTHVTGREMGHEIAWPADASKALAETCGASLLKLNVAPRASVFFADSKNAFHAFLERAPRLRALGVLDDFLAHALKLPRLDSLELLLAQPGLTTSFDSSELPSSSSSSSQQDADLAPPFPALHHVYIQASRWSRDTGFLSVQGSHITTLTLDVNDFTDFSRPDIMLRRIAALWGLMPNVTNVHLIAHREQKLGRVFLALPPSTTHLGIWALPPTTLSNHTSGLTLLEEQEVFLRGAPELPAPSVVRLTNPEHARWIREEVLEGSVLGKMGPAKGRGTFRLEDHEGEVLVEVEGDGEV